MSKEYAFAILTLASSVGLTQSGTALIGVESKRFEPFHDRKIVELSKAYHRDVWGDQMAPFTAMRDALRAGTIRFAYLDAAQLVKPAFGLVTEGRRVGKRPMLFYLHAEPSKRGAIPITTESLQCHRAEIDIFALSVIGAEIRFESCSYREWLAGWTGEARQHASALLTLFSP